MATGFNSDFKTNKIDIKIDAPTFILPFNQTNLEQIEAAACWVFTVGDAKLCSIEQSDHFDYSVSEGFEFKVERMKFEYASNYKKWKQTQKVYRESTSLGGLLNCVELNVEAESNSYDPHFRVFKLLQDFTTSVIIIRKRGESEMETQSAVQRLKADKSAELRIIAKFETELQFVLRPDEFKMLTEIGSLFTYKVVDAEYYVKKMNKRIDDSIYNGQAQQLNKANIIGQYSKGVAVLEKVGNLAFFDERDFSYVTNFDIEGCLSQENCETIGQVLRLINKHGAEYMLVLNSEKAAKRWQLEIMDLAKQVKEELDTVL